MVIVKVILILSLIFTGVQDIKQRQIYWVLIPIIGVCCGLLYYNSTLPELFLSTVGLNVVFLGLLCSFIFLYTKAKLGVELFDVIGLGDLLLFLGVAFSFSTVSFIVIFISSLVFSLIIHLLVSKGKQAITVPLAGYICLFFALIYLSLWTGVISNVYSI